MFFWIGDQHFHLDLWFVFPILKRLDKGKKVLFVLPSLRKPGRTREKNSSKLAVCFINLRSLDEMGLQEY